MANRGMLAATMGLSLALAGVTPGAAQNREPEARDTLSATLERFAQDYALDPSAIDVVFGIEVDGMRWHVTSRSDGARRTVTLGEGFPDEPHFYFRTDRETLNLLEQRVWNGLTAMGAASSADSTPLDILFSDGFERSPEHEIMTRRLIFHFWTTGLPEKTRFSSANARVVHGAPASVLYYDEDFRSAVYHVPAGLGRDMAPTIAVPFPRMILIIGGETDGLLGAEAFSAKAGEMLLLPANIPATFWNASQERGLSFVWLMWGDGA